MIADAATLAAANRRSLAVARDWRAGEPYRSLDDAFARVDPGDAAAAADIAERLLRESLWVSALLYPLIAALGDDPWFEPPLKVSRDPLRTGAVLYEGSVATLSAVVLSGDALMAMPRAETVVASGRLAVVRYVRSGNAWSAALAGGTGRGGGSRADRSDGWCAHPSRRTRQRLFARRRAR